jgi:uncharacterized RDD family membrane protein YckC
MTFAPPAVTAPAGPDPTAVVGRRIGAYLIDYLVPLVLAVVAGFALFFSSAVRVTNAGASFCERYNFNSSTISDAVYREVGTGGGCLQVGDDEALVASSDDTGRAVLAGLAVFGLAWVNLFILQGITGASAAKHLLGLRVVRGDGSRVGFGWNALRTVLLFVDSFCFGIVGLITVNTTKRHQRVGDLASGTYVVRKEYVGTPVAVVPPVAATWQPPATGAAWGTPAPTWGSPTPTPMSTPTSESQTPTWGQPVTPTWAAPEPAVPTETSPSVDGPTESVPPTMTQPESPGWAAPTPAVAPTPAPAPQPTQQAPAMSLPPGAEMRWDERWNAWLYWDPTAQRWLRHDPATNQWIPM